LLALLLLSIPAIAQNDNCCSVDRQCETDEEWVAGYYARQNNECGAPSPQQATSAQASSAQSQSAKSEDNDNCCFSGWQCETDADWASGFFAFQVNLCAAGPQQQSESSQSQSQSRNNNNQAQPQGDNQPQPQNDNNQPQPQNNNPEPQNADPQPQPQNNNPEPQPQNDGQPGDTHSVVIDLNDPDPEPTETDRGAPVYIVRITKEQFCSLFPDEPWCR